MNELLLLVRRLEQSMQYSESARQQADTLMCLSEPEKDAIGWLEKLHSLPDTRS